MKISNFENWIEKLFSNQFIFVILRPISHQALGSKQNKKEWTVEDDKNKVLSEEDFCSSARSWATLGKETKKIEK
jgi:hypothetical protein